MSMTPAAPASIAPPAPATHPHHGLSRHQPSHIHIPACNHRLYVGNIPWDASEDEIIEECSIFGRIVSFKLVRDKETGKHRGYGFLDFADEESALCAKRNQKGLILRGRQLKVCDPTRNDNKQKQQQQQQQKFQSPGAAISIPSSGPPPSNPTPIKRPEAAISIPSSGPLPSNPAPIKRPREDADAAEDSRTSANKRLHIHLPQLSAAPALHIVGPHRSEAATAADDYVEPYSPSAPAIPWSWDDVHKVWRSTSVTAATVSGKDDRKPHVQQPKPETKPTTTLDRVGLTGGDVEDADQRSMDDLVRLAFSLCTARHTAATTTATTTC